MRPTHIIELRHAARYPAKRFRHPELLGAISADFRSFVNDSSGISDQFFCPLSCSPSRSSAATMSQRDLVAPLATPSWCGSASQNRFSIRILLLACFSSRLRYAPEREEFPEWRFPCVGGCHGGAVPGGLVGAPERWRLPGRGEEQVGGTVSGPAGCGAVGTEWPQRR